MIKQISDLTDGDTAKVLSVNRKDALGIRLLELGFTPGTPVQLIRSASKRGPIEVLIRGCRLMIGLPEAQSSDVQA